MTNQYDACMKLLSAVVALAIRDASQNNGALKNKNIIRDEVKSALSFLFEHSDGYLELLNIDPTQFRNRLLDLMSGKTNQDVFGMTDMDFRNMRLNYQAWKKFKGEQNELLQP